MARNKFAGFISRDREGWDDIMESRFCSVVVGAIGAAVVGGIMAGDAADTAAGASANATASSERVAQQQLELARAQDGRAAKADARADEQWLRYKQTYQPLEDQMVDEAKGLDSMANQNKAATDAAAGVQGAFASARERLAKNPGVNPSSQQYLQESSKIGLAEAATSAAAQTGARESVKDRAAAARTNAVSLGKGLPALAQAGYGAAGGLAGSAATMAGAASGIYAGIGAGARADGQIASANQAAVGKAIGGIFQTKGVQNWLDKSFSSAPDIPMTSAQNYGAYPANSGYDPSGYVSWD